MTCLNAGVQYGYVLMLTVRYSGNVILERTDKSPKRGVGMELQGTVMHNPRWGEQFVVTEKVRQAVTATVGTVKLSGNPNQSPWR